MKKSTIPPSRKTLVVLFFLSVFSSIGSLSGDVLPVAFQATRGRIPEMGPLFPVIGLIVAVAITQILRRRRIAHLRSGTPSAH